MGMLFSPDPLVVPPPVQTLRIEVTPKTLIAVVVVVGLTWVVIQIATVLLVLVGAMMIVGALNPLVAGLAQVPTERRHCAGFRRGADFGGGRIFFGSSAARCAVAHADRS
jgi:hypothetical protein